MAVVYMKKLEEEPQTYEKTFTKLTKGLNQKAKSWIIENIRPNSKVLEAGCGSGFLSISLAQKGINVVAFDQNKNMVTTAQQNLIESKTIINTVQFVYNSAQDLGQFDYDFDYIVSTFMVSELRPFEQQRFLREAWSHLKPNGVLIIAEEFEPEGLKRLVYRIKRYIYKKKLKQLRKEPGHPLQWFKRYLSPLGFKSIETHSWGDGSIQVMMYGKQMTSLSSIATEMKTSTPSMKISLKPSKPSKMTLDRLQTGFYHPPPHRFNGFRSFLRVLRCVLTGQSDPVPIEPGIYRSGNPSPESPIIVTANYEYTYIKVMRDLEGIDAWILCVDSRGINVWCAARGNDFGNKQLIEAVENSGIATLVSHKKLILPQLCAGGVSQPTLPKTFPFKISYGPVWSKDLSEYLRTNPKEKPEHMRVVKFNFKRRLEAAITHTTFLLRYFVLIPTIICLILASLMQSHLIFQIVGIFWMLMWIIGISVPLLMPLTNFTRLFSLKGIIFGIPGAILLGLLTIFLLGFPFLIPAAMLFIFWLIFFVTMSFSGYTMETSPREIGMEYPTFTKINHSVLYLAIISTFIGVILEWVL